MIQLVLQLKDHHYNVAFDNWYSSQKCLDILTSVGIPTVGTAREDRIGECPLKAKLDLKKEARGKWVYGYDLNIGLKVTKWHDNAAVALVSNALDPFPVEKDGLPKKRSSFLWTDHM